MAQSINIKIAGRPYNLTATSPEHEEVIRKAADEVNSKIAQYQQKFPNKGLTEILSFMALNVNMNNIVLMKQVNGMRDAEDKLAKELERYLDDIDRTSR
ncbi:MAG: cell division protein ZapA [Bacteroidales bacterium]|nr:cell division protein ZapA [Bacteroidales bacterium]